MLALVMAVMLAASAAYAQVEASSSQARTAQYAFVIDDSGSMRIVTRDGPAADPDRLAVFATRSLLSMLDDRDEVTIVRLNGPDQGEAIPLIQPLAENRRRLDQMLDLGETIAGYRGQQTPCRAALEATKAQLNAAYRPNVMQVVVFLTDGECTGRDVNPAEFLRGLRSHDDGMFQFYLLRWRGRVFSRSLVALADQTGGVAVEVGATDPTELLQPFASVLSRSQGYEAYLLSPTNKVMEAHRGARRVRLLAVAPDKGQDLKFSIDPTARGEDPVLLGSTRTGLHQYEDGNRYRYAALDYRPGTTPVSITVTGAGSDYRIVAVPEYRLHVRMSLTEGRCGSDGPDTNFVEVGGGICATVELVNEKNELVTSDVAGHGTQAFVRYTAPGRDRPADLPANRRGDAPTFAFERVNLEEGDHIFAPMMRLQTSGQGGSTVSIQGAARTLQVSSRRVQADPARFEFGDLRPGMDQYHELTLSGNFPASRGRLVVEGRKDVPECVTFELSGVAEVEAQPINPGQSYTVAVRVAPYCGPAAYQRALDSALRIEFDRASHSAPVPAVIVPFRATLINELGIPESIVTTIEAGEVKDLNVRMGGNQFKDVSFEALLPPRAERSGWPGRQLELAFVDERGRPIRTDRDYATTQSITFAQTDQARTNPLTLRVISDACCAAGVYRTELALVPRSGSSTPIRVPIEITVEEAGLWSCWGPTIVRSFLGLLALLLLLYLFNMYRSSHFIDRDRLAERLVPMRWDEFQEPKLHTRSVQDVKRAVRREMTFLKRAVAWLKANPLVFGLPGREYYECVELSLSHTRDLSRSRLILMPSRNQQEALLKDPTSGRGRLYVIARGGVSFFAVPEREDRVGVFAIKQDDYGTLEGYDEEFQLKLVTFRGRRELILMNSDKADDTMAGWRIG
jgi:hypothetical protein